MCWLFSNSVSCKFTVDPEEEVVVRISVTVLVVDAVGLVVDVVPNDQIVFSGRSGLADREGQASFESNLKKPVWKKRIFNKNQIWWNRSAGKNNLFDTIQKFATAKRPGTLNKELKIMFCWTSRSNKNTTVRATKWDRFGPTYFWLQ